MTITGVTVPSCPYLLVQDLGKGLLLPGLGRIQGQMSMPATSVIALHTDVVEQPYLKLLYSYIHTDLHPAACPALMTCPLLASHSMAGG